MYSIARPVLFRLEPERAHYWTLNGLKIASTLGYRQKAADCPQKVMGINFPNPVGLSAGLDKNGDYLSALSRLGFGFIEIGTITPKPQAGNPQPRMFRIPEQQAIINRLGFNNKGVDYLLGQVQKSQYQGILGINIGKNKTTPNEKATDDYLYCLRKVYAYADYITVNISSPNTAGLRDLQEEHALRTLLTNILTEREILAKKQGQYKPIALKIAPDLDSVAISVVSKTLNETSPDAVIATNTTISRIGVESCPNGHESGGLSGAPLLMQSTKILSELRKQLRADIAMIGVGGINQSQDAVKKIEAGADLVQVYSGLIYRGPVLIRQCVDALKASMYASSA